nr:MAG TPA: minor tail protein [Caudoviricetes sp.]
MAEKNLRLRVVLDLADKALAPLKRISRGSQDTAGTLKAAREQLKQLEATQKSIGTFREARTGLEGMQAQLQAARNKVRELAKSYGQAGQPTKQMAAAMAAAKEEARQLGSKFDAQRLKVQQLRDKLHAAGISTKNLADHDRQLRTSIAATRTGIEQQTQALKRQADEQRKLAKLQQQAAKGAAIGAGISGTGAVALYGGQRALRGTAGLFSAGMGFDAQMSKVQALTRLEKNSADYAMLRAQALELGASTMFSATEAAQGQAFLAMAGFDPKAIKAAMPGLLDMAKAGDLDLGRTADISSNILSAFGIDPNKMGNVADTLTKVFTSSNVNLEMLGNTMSYVGPVARAAGVDLETTAAMAGLLGNVGIQGEKGGTALRAMLLRLSAPTGGAAKMLDKLKVKTRDAQGNVRNVMEVLADLAKQTEKMGGAQKLEALKTIFGEQPAAAMTELLSQAGAGGILEYLNKVRDSAGAAGKTAGIMADNLMGDLDEMSSTWEDVRISLFDANQGEIRAWAQTITAGIRCVGDWFKANPVAAQWLVRLVVGFAALTAITGALLIPLGLIVAKTMAMRWIFAKLGVSNGIVAIFKGLFAWGSKLVPLVVRFAPMLLRLLGPVGLLITAGWMLYSNWQAIWDGGKALLSDFSNWFMGWANTIGSWLAGLWSGVKAAVSTAITGLVDGVKSILDGGVGAWVTALLNFSPMGLLWNTFTTALAALGVQMPEQFRNFGSFIMDGLIGGITGKLAALKDTVVGVASSAASWFKEKLGIASPSKVFTQFGGWISEGAANGIEAGQAAVRAAALAMAGAAAAPALAMDGPVSTGPAPMLASRASAAPVAGGHTEIHIHAAPGMDPQAIARAVSQELDRRERQRASRGRSALSDLS